MTQTMHWDHRRSAWRGKAFGCVLVGGGTPGDDMGFNAPLRDPEIYEFSDATPDEDIEGDRISRFSSVDEMLNSLRK